MDCLNTINDVEFNEHCLKLKQQSETLERLSREGEVGMLWVSLGKAKAHLDAAMNRLLEVHKEPVYLDVNQRR